VDENGKTHYGDRPPQSNQVELLDISVESFSSVEVRTLDEDDIAALGGRMQGQKKDKKVVMYNRESCGYCKKAKTYFNANGIKYSECDINKSTSARREWKKLNGTGVQLILVGKSKMSGFSAARFEKMHFN
jgi:glutaredoxin